MSAPRRVNEDEARLAFEYAKGSHRQEFGHFFLAVARTPDQTGPIGRLFDIETVGVVVVVKHPGRCIHAVVVRQLVVVVQYTIALWIDHTNLTSTGNNNFYWLTI